MRILLLNRRDIGNPAGGGAEIYTHEIAKGLVSVHHCNVTVFSSVFPGCRAEESIDGVRYVRKGNEATVHLHGFWYAFRNRRSFDRIIDEFNGIGFFTFSLKNSVLLIHQLYREFWFRELGFWGWLPYMIEPLLLRLYRRKRTITISPSTEKDLEELGFSDISIVKVAIKPQSPTDLCKDDTPTLVFLGRLKSTKRPEDAIRIYKKVEERVAGLRLWVIGRGPEEEELKNMAKDLEGVTFFGWVSEDRKYELLRRSHVLLVPGVREGFGINIIEAAAAGTPAVGYSVHGVRDAIVDGVTGYLVGKVGDAAAKTGELLGNGGRYANMCRNCLDYARDFNWDRRVDEFWSVISDLRKG